MTAAVAAPASALAALRRATAAEHEAVDAAYAGFDLTDPDAYGRFLSAHARALPTVEAALAERADLPALRPRSTLLAQDLAALGLEMPARPSFVLQEDLASAFGAAYVIEGSRLGGGMLARRVSDRLPRSYLSAVHLPGEWRAFGQSLDAASEGEKWAARATVAAVATFALYRRAATNS